MFQLSSSIGISLDRPDEEIVSDLPLCAVELSQEEMLCMRKS